MDIRELKATINTKIAEAKRELGEGNVEKATELKNEIVELKAELAGKEAELKEIEDINNLEEEVVEEEARDAEVNEEVVDEVSVENSENSENKEENKEERSLEGENKMNLNEIRKSEDKNKEVREAFTEYIRTRGKETRGVESADVGVVIPQDIITKVIKEETDGLDLTKYTKVVEVKRASGTQPVQQVATARMHTVAELEANPELAKPNFRKVDYKIETYRGQLDVSQEAIEDAEGDLTALIAEDIAQQSLNTSNAVIAETIKTFPTKTITGLDGLKTILNVDVKRVYSNVKLFVSQSFLNEIDQLKDQNARYLLSQDITSASGLRLFGREVVVLDDTVIGTNAGDKVAFVGDLNKAVIFFDRKKVSARWVENGYHGQALASFMRFDCVKADQNAGFYVTLDTTEAP